MDRNAAGNKAGAESFKSLSARRAWIEITSSNVAVPVQLVALRKESVDRNLPIIFSTVSVISSLSARRAWIEILRQRWYRVPDQSLSARRAWIEISAGT